MDPSDSRARPPSRLWIPAGRSGHDPGLPGLSGSHVSSFRTRRPLRPRRARRLLLSAAWPTVLGFVTFDSLATLDSLNEAGLGSLIAAAHAFVEPSASWPPVARLP